MVSMRSRRSSVDHSIRPTQAAAAVGGLKTIGLLGGVALLINNITGSAMVLFPSLYQAAGWFTVTMTLLLIAFLSYLCSVMIIEAMAAMPGNHTFTKRVEYTGLAYYYLGQRGYYFTQFFFQFSLAFNNMSSIIQSVQVMDFALVAIFGKDCAIPEFYPNFSFHCPEPVKHDITPFGDIYLLSIGFIITALVCAPLGFWNLDDNIIIQKVSCSAVVLMVLTWCGIFIAKGDLDGSRVPAVGDQFTNVLGTCVFNFAIITSIPSWVNEKKESVSITKTMNIALPMALGLFSVIGVFGGLAYTPWYNTSDSDETLLNKLKSSSSGVANFTFYFFPVVVNLTSIPVFAIMQRYNLLEAKVCGKKMANFLGVVLPWLVCIPFYTGQGFSSIVNWGGIIFNSTVNFIIPPLIYVAMVRRQQQRAVEVANRLGLEKIVFDDNGELEQSSPRVSSGYVPPGSSNQNDTPVGVGSMTVKVTRATSVQASASPPAASVKSSASLLGPRKDLDASASLKQGLLSSGGNYSGSGAYHASDLDIRSAEEEAKDNELLGYDPVEEERIEREQIEEEVLRKMSQQHHHPGGSHSLQHPGATASGPSANMRRAEEVLSPSDSIDGTNAHEFHVHSLGWQAMPQWVRPWRIHMALGVAGFLTLVALTVVALNIQQCATGNGC